MTEVVEAAEGIYRVKLSRDRAFVSCDIYLLRGDLGAIIETGPSSVVHEVLEALSILNWYKTDIVYVILTHVHLDHAGGASKLIRALPNAQVVAHHRGARHLIDPTRLTESTRHAYGDNFDEKYGAILPVSSERVLTVHGGEVLDLGSRELEIHYTPGHAPHQIAILDRKTRGLFCGDALGEYFRKLDLITPVAAPPFFDVEAAKESLRNIRRLKPAMLIFSHGGVRRDVDRVIDLVEQSIAGLSGIAHEAFRQGLNAEELSKRLGDYDEKLAAALVRPDIPDEFREGLIQKRNQVAGALLAYYAGRND